MSARSILEKFLQVLLLIGAAVFLGGGIIRAAIAYDIFIPGTLLHKPFLTEAQINYSIRLYAVTAFYTLFGYAVMLAGVLGITITRRREFRNNGGIFMAVVLFYCCLPIECYASVLDIRLLQTISPLPFDAVLSNKELQTIFAERLSPRMSSAGFLTLLAYFSAILLAVWRPLSARINGDKQ